MCCSHLPGLEVILDAVLETFSFRLERRHDQAVTNKVCRVSDALAGAKAANTNTKYRSGPANWTITSIIYHELKFLLRFFFLPNKVQTHHWNVKWQFLSVLPELGSANFQWRCSKIQSDIAAGKPHMCM